MNEPRHLFLLGETGDLSRRGFVTRSCAAAFGCVLGGRVGRALAAQGVIDGPPTIDDSYHYYAPNLTEITQPGPIILPDGTSQRSWSRRPYLDLNFEDASFLRIRSAQPLRMKKWEMYHMVTPTHYISLLIAWIGYAAFCAALVYTRKSRECLEDIHIRSAYPELAMMRTSAAGRTVYTCKKVRTSFEVNGEVRKLRVDWPTFADVGLRAKIDLHQPADHESICATHLTNPKRSHYSHKINCTTATGEFRLGDETVRLAPPDAFGMLDFGRGYYPSKMFWYWITASGRDDAGKLIGWNLGHHNRAFESVENAVFYDGRLHKIGVCRCQVPKGDLMQPWRVQSEDGKVDLTLTPEKVRNVQVDLGSLHSIGRPAFGLYNGHVKLDDGRVIKVRNLFGLYEWIDQKW